MIQCLTNDDWRTEGHTLLDMHRLRCRVFKERLDWEVSDTNGFEWDSFDTQNPIYIVAKDACGRVSGTWRMLPTTGPYMLRDVFPQLLDGLPAPRGPRIWEGSRFAVDCGSEGSRAGLAALGRTTAEIFCAVVELSLALGAEEVVTVYDARIARLLPRLGVQPTWRGTPVRIGNTIAMAGRFDISEDVLAGIRERTGLVEPVLAHTGAVPALALGGVKTPVGASATVPPHAPHHLPRAAANEPDLPRETAEAAPPQKRAA